MIVWSCPSPLMIKTLGVSNTALDVSSLYYVKRHSLLSKLNRGMAVTGYLL